MQGGRCHAVSEVNPNGFWGHWPFLHRDEKVRGNGAVPYRNLVWNWSVSSSSVHFLRDESSGCGDFPHTHLAEAEHTAGLCELHYTFQNS